MLMYCMIEEYLYFNNKKNFYFFWVVIVKRNGIWYFFELGLKNLNIENVFYFLNS